MDASRAVAAGLRMRVAGQAKLSIKAPYDYISNGIFKQISNQDLFVCLPFSLRKPSGPPRGLGTSIRGRVTFFPFQSRPE
jgi:hypothetical protein